MSKPAVPSTPIRLQVGLSQHMICYAPRDLFFSWTMPCHGYQTAYRLVIKSGDMGDCVYDSLWVESNQNTAVTSQELMSCLLPDRLYTCQVALKLQAPDAASIIEHPFSDPVDFVVAPILDHALGLWAGHDLFAFLRREFTISPTYVEQMSRAVLTLTATSAEPARQYVYYAYLDGASVGLGPTRLDKSRDGQHMLYFQSYDVTALLNAGQHCLGAVCYTAEEQAFYARLTIYDHLGVPTVIFDTQNASAWQALPGDAIYRPENSIGTHYFKAHACNIDGPLYPHGFAKVGYDARNWHFPSVRDDLTQKYGLFPAPTANLCEFPAPCHNVKVHQTPTGSYLVDLGHEIVGGFCLALPCSEPTEITLTYGEELTPEGHVLSPMRTGNRYTEVWRTSPQGLPLSTLSLMTFRYVEITDSPTGITPDMVQGLEFRLPFSEGDAVLVSDHPLLNRIWTLVQHTIKVTTQELYVDSQSRERTAYEGDLLINLMAAYACGGDRSAGRFTIRYLCTHRTWPAEYPLFVIMSAWADYMATGEMAFLEDYAPLLEAMVFTDHLHPQLQLIASPGTAPSQMNSVLVDWPASERDSYDMTAPFNTVFNALCVAAYEDLAHIFTALQDVQRARTYATLAETIKESMIARLYDPQDGGFYDGCDLLQPTAHKSQHATAFCLACGIYDSPTMKNAMAKFLENQGEIRMSVYGSYFLLKGLYQSGHGDIANRLMLSKDTDEGARTWAYMLDTLGATITTEAWNRCNKPNMTYSHPWGAAPAHMIATGIFGISPTSPAYKSFDIIPSLPEGVTHAAYTLPTVSGGISVSWDASKGIYRITVPFNTTASLYLPDGQGYRKIQLTSGEHIVNA